MDVNTPLGGSMPIEATPVLTYSGLLLTSVAATSTHDYTVAFMGTATGHLKKAVVESVTSAFEYSDLQIDEAKSVSPDMLFDKNKEFLYVMTERRVTMVKVQECLVYKTCSECLEAQDPYCGWCSLENNCTQCVSSPFPCDWCVGGHRCTHDTGENCRNDILVTGISSIGPSIRSGPGFCPRINTTSGGSIEILVPSGISKRIQVKVDNIQPIIASTRFVCQFNIEGRVRQVHAQLLGDTIYCEPMVFAYGTQAPNITTAFAVIWDGSKPLDNPENIHVLVYRCQGMAQNCGICLELPDKYACGWCQDPPSSCQVHEQCSADPTQWLDHSQTCPDPKITKFYPESGPWEGGTNITIEGINLGRVFEDVAGGVKVVYDADGRTIAECLPHKENYRKTSKIVCQVESPRNLTTGLGRGSIAGPIVVKVQNDYIARSKKQYSFVNPRITSVEPSKGPKSGGTRLRIWGLHMDAGSRAEAFVDGLECKVTGRRNCVECITSASKEKGPGKVRVKFDNGLRIFEDYNFLYVDDPVIAHVESGSGQRGTPKGIPSINFCLLIGFFQGQNLDRASQESDVIVRIGTSYCNVTSLSRSQLTCRPPTSQPYARDIAGFPVPGQLPEVVVEVGDILKFPIGKLSYELPSSHDSALSKPVIIGVIVGGCILVIIVIIILIAYRQKSTESSRVLKNMQEQMDVLELRVASECKEAFAELQTEMTDLTSDLTAGGIPFLDYQSYAMKVLFPNSDDHPVLREMQLDPLKKSYIEKGLRLYGQLIMNKIFLLLFIRTLESNRYFSMRDRVNVASLIMVTLQGKMEYCTDILKTLLAELIEKCIEGKSHPKLLLRRTESVAEKMLSSWFTFLLYKFLRECAGDPLFMLYRAIKQQVDKGPVDAITSEARYSLSEEKLIRQSIEYKSMTVYVSMSLQTQYVSGLEPPGENIETPVKVLDCDTILQVKEKALDTIYKSTSFTQRPSKEDLDLEWRTGTSGRLTLSDEDATTKQDGEWKRLNTLAHYKVPDGALLTLVPKQSSMYNLSIMTDKVDRHKYETLNFSLKTSPTLSRATSPLNHDPESGYKYWHLVKHHDAENNKEGERGNKMVSEIYLTRLLATKGTLQKFVDDLFETIFSTAHRGSALPLAIKYMFDFLDDQALNHAISDPEVVHTWKSNSLPLRFWVNLIKNPNFVFDIYKTNIVDSCLSVVAQTFMDACSTSEHRLGKDSPSSKLLYAKDIPIYKDWVERYYQDIQLMPAISDQDMNAMLAEESRLHAHEFNTNVALYELYSYAVKYNDQLMQTLEEDEFSRKNKLAWKLEQVHAIMSGESEA
ncbi:hypothetical protein TNIN_425621 [Trichonephila inaurata madagascariensis]|uniref:Sema domain-containing protein n=1 Tax=Trichonephila inaurata madagascariensis TaxID=2747483 RepID=A0A8X6YQ48_9ARAC|nr:hypothetical protein TNIN_425621 [Trichonephila inaurata madagascariensis]